MPHAAFPSKLPGPTTATASEAQVGFIYIMMTYNINNYTHTHRIHTHIHKVPSLIFWYLIFMFFCLLYQVFSLLPQHRVWAVLICHHSAFLLTAFYYAFYGEKKNLSTYLWGNKVAKIMNETPHSPHAHSPSASHWVLANVLQHVQLIENYNMSIGITSRPHRRHLHDWWNMSIVVFVKSFTCDISSPAGWQEGSEKQRNLYPAVLCIIQCMDISQIGAQRGANFSSLLTWF